MLVAAMAANRTIGDRGRMPWHIPEELARFRRLTWGHPILMGRLTHEAIGKPLPGRTNIVLSGRSGYAAAGCCVAPTLERALELARLAEGGEQIMVIGGATLYEQCLEQATGIWLTVLEREYPGDVCFPHFEVESWSLCSRESATGRDRGIPLRFRVELWMRDCRALSVGSS